VAANNSGQSTLTADSCAGCHRAHTAQAPLLLVEDEEDICLACHGATGTGAATNVENGVQYALAAAGSGTVRGTAILGALRNGGFTTAAIGSGSGVRVAYLSGTNTRQNAKVPVRVDGTGAIAGQAVTSTHMNLADPGAVVTAWGSGAISATENPGGTTTMSCASCHNPHGNGQYRILNPIPSLGGGTAAPVTTPAVVADAALPPTGDTRNYTVIQQPNGTLLASQAAAFSNTAGDYWHRKVPWNGVSGTVNDAPNGQAATFNGQINAWCAQCHSRYLAVTGAPYEEDSGDAIFTYRHSNTSNKPCTTCHVAHGSNAQITPDGYSAGMTYPGGAAAPATDSRLLKIDNRGTCQACHDPTGTITVGTQVGPTPVPVLP
jgi:predicted CXXCH cytochrome family protein